MQRLVITKITTFIYIAKIDQLNLNIKTAGINLCELIKYLKLVLAIKKIIRN